MTYLLSLEEKWVPVGNRTRVYVIARMLNATRGRALESHVMFRANRGKEPL